MRKLFFAALALAALSLTSPELSGPALAGEPAPAKASEKIQTTPKAQKASQKPPAAGTQKASDKKQQAHGSPEAPHAYPAQTFNAATFSLSVPVTVEEGGMVLAHLRGNPDVSAVTLHWQGKPHRVVLHQGQGLALLPAPLEPKSRTEPLEAVSGKDRLSLSIAVAPVNWAVQKISVESKYVDPPKEVMNRIAADRERTRAALATVHAERYWTPPFVRPVPGDISSAYGGKRVFNGKPRSRHRGVDLRGAQGTPIAAAAAGRVILAEEQYYSGNVVYVDHGQGLVTMYCHMSAMQVAPGDPVQAGQTLGLVGATGRVTGPHLHLSTLLYGESVNPMALFVYE